MRNTLLIVLLLSLFYSCTKEPILISGRPLTGEGVANKNGEFWNYRMAGYFEDDGDSLIRISMFTFQNETDFLRETLSFENIIPITNEKQIIYSDTLKNRDFLLHGNYNTVLGHGDVTGDRYEVNGDVDNWIKITAWNEVSGELEGTFQCEFYFIEEEHETPDAPDTVRITDGEFNVIIEEW